MLYDDLAALLDYPLGPLKIPLAENPETARLLGEFAKPVLALHVEEREELYTRTFDINPLCSLEAGWQLYGENYERGRFLVTMRQQLRRFELAESAELPDHLTQVLMVLARMTPTEAAQFAAQLVLPAVEKMLAGLQGKGNPYEFLLQALRTELCHQTGLPPGERKPEMNLFPILEGVEQ